MGKAGEAEKDPRAPDLQREDLQRLHAQHLSEMGGPDPFGRENLYNALNRSKQLGMFEPSTYRLASAIGARLEPPVPVHDTQLICAAVAQRLPLPPPGKGARNYVSSGFSNVPAASPQWVWDQRVPRGKFSVLEADGGAESVALVGALAAAVSGRQPIRAGESVIEAEVALVMEDDTATEIYRPLLGRLGAVLPKVRRISGVVLDGAEVELDLARDLPELTAFCQDHPEVKLMIVNLLETFVTARDKAGMRKCLLALARLAKQYDVAIVGVCDPRSAVAKEATKVARMVWALREDPRILGRWILFPVKRDLGAAPAVAFRLEGDSLAWEEGSIEDPSQVLRGKQARPRQQEADWILGKLANGPQLMSVMIDNGVLIGFSKRTLERAKLDLGVRSFRREGRWYWQLPAARS